MENKEYLEFAKEIAYEAGKIMLKYFNTKDISSYKGDKTIVTLADKEINTYLINRVKEKFPDKNIWCYSGYTFETDIMGKMYNNWKETPEILSYIDVLVDGKFEEDKKDIKLRFRGSSNQRIIDVKKSLKENKAVLFEF